MFVFSLPPLSANTNALASAVAPASSQTMMWKYLTSIGLYSAVVIAGLLTFLWLLKTKPAFVQQIRSWVGMSTPPPAETPKLKVEEVLELEADKQLMIIQCEHERFLVSSGADGLRFLTKLGTESALEAMMHAPSDVHIEAVHEDSAGTRGIAINPNDSGISTPSSPVQGVQSALVQGVKSLIPPAQTTLKSWGSGSHPPFGLK